MLFWLRQLISFLEKRKLVVQAQELVQTDADDLFKEKTSSSHV